MTQNNLTFIQDQIGYKFNNLDLLQQAFIRRSYSEENGGENNEVLEFIGDKVLDLFVVKYLTEKYGYMLSECEDYDSEEDYYAHAADWMGNWGEAVNMWAMDGISWCKYLTIRIKGEEGGEENKLIMDWHPEDAKFYAARFSDLVLADGTHPVITTEWQDLVIDLEASGFPGMTNAFHIRAFARCKIWLDEITFSEAVAPIDSTSSDTIQAGMTVPETGKPGDLPIKDYIAELNK